MNTQMLVSRFYNCQGPRAEHGSISGRNIRTGQVQCQRVELHYQLSQPLICGDRVERTRSTRFHNPIVFD